MNSHLDGGDADNAHNNISPKFWQTHAVQKNLKAILQNRQEQRT